MSAVFAIISYLMNKIEVKPEEKKEEKHYAVKNNRPYAEDRRLLNQLLRNDLRQAIV